MVTTKTLDECHSWEEVLDLIRTSEQEVRLGGGETAVARQHKKGRLTARERIERLIDPHQTREVLQLSLEVAALNPRSRNSRQVCFRYRE